MINQLTGHIIDYQVCERTDTYTEITIRVGTNVDIEIDTTNAYIPEEIWTDQTITALNIDNIAYSNQPYPNMSYPRLKAAADQIIDAEQ